MNKIVTFGEIMLRLAPEGFLRFSQANRFDIVYGGGEANVAVSLANFGLDTNFITRLPNNEIGHCAIMEIRKHGVGVDNIIWGGNRLGIYFLETGAVSRASNIVYDRANSAFSEIESGMIDWNKIFKDATFFHWSGITPSISKNAAEVCLEAVKVASKKGLKISTDFNFRSKLWKYCDINYRNEIMNKLTSYCHIINCNEYDVKEFFGINPESAEENKKFLSICKQMMHRYPKIEKIVTAPRGTISASHNSWKGLLFDGEKLYETNQYQITDIVDRVGGGDAFMAGLIYGLINYKNNNQKALDFATAASCLKHTIKGDFNLVSVEEVEQLMNGDGSGRVKR